MTLNACATLGFVCNSGMRQRQILLGIVYDHVEGMCNSGIRVQQRDATTTNHSRILHDHVEGNVQQRDSCATAGCDNDKSFSNSARSRRRHVQQRDSRANSGMRQGQILLDYCTITLKACETAKFVCNSRMRQRQILLEYCTITLKECATAGFMCHSRMRQRQKSFSNTARSR